MTKLFTSFVAIDKSTNKAISYLDDKIGEELQVLIKSYEDKGYKIVQLIEEEPIRKLLNKVLTEYRNTIDLIVASQNIPETTLKSWDNLLKQEQIKIRDFIKKGLELYE